MINKQASCEDIYEEGLIPLEKALEHILQTVGTVQGTEQIVIEKARGRCLAEPVIATMNVPTHNNSAVDGYAVYDEDLSQRDIVRLEVVGTAFAGKPYLEEMTTGQCLRIMTGAILPEGLNTVVMQEHVEQEGNCIVIGGGHKSGQNVRLVGEDISEGQVILKPGKYLTPPDIGLLASLGIAEIKVKRKLRIAIASSGDEVYGLGERRSDSGIYDSNRYSLLAALARADTEFVDLGIIDDNPQSLLSIFQKTANYADVIISTGGVSVGDADYTKKALQESGKIDFWKIAIKPGRPLAFGHINNAVFFGLPGNPVAVLVTFYQFVLPALEKMLGICDKPLAPVIKAQALENIRKRAGRTEIQRGILEQDTNGEWLVKTTGKQGSGILRSMSLANAFIVLEHDRESVKVGEYVNVQPFAGLF